jgi:hypothetical protein
VNLNEFRERLDSQEFTPGDRVAYVPTHADGDMEHTDVELGTVSSLGNGNIVFVRFDKQVQVLGWDGTTSQACDKRDLRRIEIDKDS